MDLLILSAAVVEAEPEHIETLVKVAAEYPPRTPQLQEHALVDSAAWKRLISPPILFLLTLVSGQT